MFIPPGDAKFSKELYQRAFDTAEQVYDFVCVTNQIVDIYDLIGDKELVKQILTEAQKNLQILMT